MKKSENPNDLSPRLAPENIEATWTDHCSGCAFCPLVNTSMPATFVNSCAEGAVYLKALLAARAAPELAAKRKAENLAVKEARGKHFVSKATAKSAMRYK